MNADLLTSFRHSVLRDVNCVIAVVLREEPPVLPQSLEGSLIVE
jgi:hypothetical protein